MSGLRKLTLGPRAKEVVYTAWNGMQQLVAAKKYLAWPPVESDAEMEDLAARLRFYFQRGERVVVPRVSRDIQPPKGTPEVLADYPIKCRMEFPVVGKMKRSVLELALMYKGLLIHAPVEDQWMANYVRYLPNVVLIGGRIVEAETSWVLKLFHKGQQRRVNESHKRFQAWRKRLPRKKKVYVLCTGPSLAKYRDFDFSDGHVIGCNTIVRNTALMEYAKPDAVVACDPIFFFGPSSYAHAFRQDLRDTLDRFPYTFFTMDLYHSVIDNHLQDHADRMLLVNQYHPDVMSDLAKSWQFPKTQNVLTLMMLPLAFTLAREIYIIGADGRDPSESYFWKHDPASQLTDKMQAIKDAHPLFFENTNYEDYYDRHCETLRKQVEWIEQRGSFVYSLTDSFVPVLKARKRSNKP